MNELTDEELIADLKERVAKLEDENYTLREELKGIDVDIDAPVLQYVCMHNRLKSFDDEGFVPVSNIGDSNTRKTIVEFQTGDEELNVRLSEFVALLLNEKIII